MLTPPFTLRRVVNGLLLIALLLTLLPVAAADAQTIPPPSDAPTDLASVPAALRISDGSYYKPGEVLVALRHATETPQILRRGLDAEMTSMTPLDVRGSEQLAQRTLRTAAAPQAKETPVGYILSVPAGQEWATIFDLRQDPNVLFAQPNWVIEAAQGATAETPFPVNDTFYQGEQWYLQRMGWSRALPVVNDHANRDERIRVAVIDSGIDTTHPDFGGRVRPVKSYVRDGNGNLVVVDDYGHGTHIAGLIGATLNNSLGITGVAPEVVLDPYKVLDSRGSGYIADAADGIRAAADNNADIINMSFSIRAAVINDPANVELDYLLHSAIYYARDKDVLLIAAAGNRYPEPVTFPAAYPEVVAVAATDYRDQWASYSAVGNEVEIAAPGGTSSQPLASTWPVGLPCTSTVGGVQGYCTKYGTSFSTGLVSGVAALMLTMDPTLTSDELRMLLKETAASTDNTRDQVGAGLLDAVTAVRTLLTPEATVVNVRGGEAGYVAAPQSAPLRPTLLISNASATPVAWQLSKPDNASWLVFTGRPNATRTVSGNAAFDQEAQIGLTLSPGALPPGVYTARMEFTSGTGPAAITSAFDVKLAIVNAQRQSYLPLAVHNGTPTMPQSAGRFEWATPNSAGRTIVDLQGDQAVALPLPFALPLGGRSYTDLRIHADGFITFPASETDSVAPGRCLPTVSWPNQAVYGWWADLEPGAATATISTFRTADDRYVVEFEAVPLASGGVDDVVTFQIALERSGTIRLNYRQTPTSGRATVGVEALDGRLFNLVHCADGVQQFGLPPAANQTLIIGPEGVY